MRWIVHLEGGPRRVNHAAVAIGAKIYSFGGYCTGEDYRDSRPMDIHVLNTVSYRWYAIPLPDSKDPQYKEIPFQRYGHTAVNYKDSAYIWGGRNDSHACNQLFRYDIATHTWSRIFVKGRLPGARDGHSACVINQQMFIFGGYEEAVDQFSQEVHALNLVTMTWSFIATKGEPPSWRDFHSATALGNCMYIFGGRGDRNGPFHSPDEIYCNQIKCLDTATRTWSQPITSGAIPDGRRSHSAFVYKDKLYIFGGYNGSLNQHFDDLFHYNPVNCQWTAVKVQNRGPCARRRQCCCIVGDHVFLFGGTSPYPDRYQGSHSALQNDIDPSLMDHNDLYVLDFAPTLKTLCKLVVIEHGIDQSCLPLPLRSEIRDMTTNNNISRPLNSAG